MKEKGKGEKMKYKNWIEKVGNYMRERPIRMTALPMTALTIGSVYWAIDSKNKEYLENTVPIKGRVVDVSPIDGREDYGFTLRSGEGKRIYVGVEKADYGTARRLSEGKKSALKNAISLGDLVELENRIEKNIDPSSIGIADTYYQHIKILEDVVGEK